MINFYIMYLKIGQHLVKISTKVVRLRFLAPALGTNLIHDFTAVTFSVKLTSFREKRRFPLNP